jgi:hypothetical protein
MGLTIDTPTRNHYPIQQHRRIFSMKSNDNVHPFSDKRRDFLDELMERENTDEMGLLDLIFAEEMLDQIERDNAA